MNFLYYCFFLCLFLSFISFSKKLIFLLSLEIMMIFLIGMFFFSSFKNLGNLVFSNMMLFLIFMVLDSVLGITLLISSSRSSSKFNSLIIFL